MGHGAPRRTLAAALSAAAAANGPATGGLLATAPPLADRLAQLAPLAPLAAVAARAPAPR